MFPRLAKKLLLALSPFLAIGSITAQEMVDNGGFEINTALPDDYSQWDYCTGWDNVNLTIYGASPDYYHVDGSSIAQLPDCWAATVEPHTGDAVMGFIATPTTNFVDWREYVSAEMNTPMVAGQTYLVSLWVTNGETNMWYGGGIEEFGFDFSVGPLDQDSYEPIEISPDYVYPGLLWNTEWQEISFVFVADDNYDRFTIGNFNSDLTTTYTHMTVCEWEGAYYFLDDISITPFDSPETILDISKCVEDGYTLADGTVVTEPGTYTIIIPAVDGSDSIIQYNISNYPSITFSGSVIDTLCTSNDPILLSLTPDGGTFSGDGVSDNYFDPSLIDNTGDVTITYTFTDANGCTGDTTIVITLIENTADAGPDVTIIYGDSTELNGTTNGSYLWSPDAFIDCATCPSTWVTPNMTTWFTLYSVDDYGCSAIDSVLVTVTSDIPIIYIPNAFTPNQDGINDIFTAFGVAIINIENMQIFDRWGACVYNESDLEPSSQNGWDGTLNGTRLNQGVYVYMITLKDAKGAVSFWTGNVTLVR